MPLVPEEMRSAVDFNPEGAVALLGSEVGGYLAEGLHPVQAARLLPHYMKQRHAQYEQQQMLMEQPGAQVDPSALLQAPSVQFMSQPRGRDLLLAAGLRIKVPDGMVPLSLEESVALFACFSAKEARRAIGPPDPENPPRLSPAAVLRLDKALSALYGRGQFQACGAAVAAGAGILPDEQGLTVVHRAAKSGQLGPLVPALREGGAELADLMATSKGQNPLHFAAEQGDAAAVDVMQAAGVRPDAMTVLDHLGFAPVHLAAVKGHGPFVRALGRYLSPAQLTALSANDMSAAHCAGEAGHAAVFDALADSGVAVATMVLANARGYTPLHYAAEHGYVHPRLAAQETPEQRDQRLEGSKQVIDTLVRLGMAREVAVSQDEEGYSPFHLAAQLGNVPALRSMYHASLNPEAVVASCRRYGNTPLTISAEHNHPAVLQFFLREARLPLSLALKPTHFGNTPIHYAASRGDTKMIAEFVADGANSDDLLCKNKADLTPLDFAQSNGHGQAVGKAFRDAGVPAWKMVALPASPRASTPRAPSL